MGALDELDRRGIAGPTHTVLDDTRPVSQEDHDKIETILNPNVPTGGESPKMTGTGPGGSYEKEMIDGLNALAARVIGWAPGTGGTPDRYPVPAGGETVQQVRDRTGVTEVRDASDTVWVDASHTFAAGEVLHLVGVRWHTAIAEDTRGQVATQHGIVQAALERANRLTPAAPSTPIAVGTVLLIPVK